MDEKAFLVGICPKCRNTIQIPNGLDSFSCVYCGARLTPDQLLSNEAARENLDFQALLEELEKAIPEAIMSYPNVFKHVTKAEFPGYFQSYMGKYREVFEKIPQLCSGSQSKLMAQELAKKVVHNLDQRCGTSRRGLQSKESLLEEAKFTICLLTIPAIRSLEHIGCEDFCQALHEEWKNQYPKNDFALTSYESIMAGFKPRKLCFITTATCHQAGKPDSCPELTAFRAFRDGYLSRQPDGQKLIDAYYAIAPRIVMAIDLCHDPQQVYPAIWETWLAPCYEALGRGDHALCKELYVKMVQTLAQEYLGEDAAA